MLKYCDSCFYQFNGVANIVVPVPEWEVVFQTRYSEKDLDMSWFKQKGEMVVRSTSSAWPGEEEEQSSENLRESANNEKLVESAINEELVKESENKENSTNNTSPLK